jgi:hypothetical protein
MLASCWPGQYRWGGLVPGCLLLVGCSCWLLCSCCYYYYGPARPEVPCSMQLSDTEN